MRLIDGAGVHAALNFPGLVEALAEGHRRGVDLKTECLLIEPGGATSPNAAVLLPAWQVGRALGIKLVTSFPGNLGGAAGLPTVQGLYVLFDGRTGTPTAVLDGEALTLRKTAADSALGSRFLSRPDSRTLLMVGAGALAPHVIAAHLAVRPAVERVLVWNRTPGRAEAVAGRLAAEGRAAEAVRDLEAAVAAADIVACATGSDRPLVLGRWLRPGMHLDLIGGWRPDMREVDDEAVARASLFADQREAAGRCGDIGGPLAAGLIGADAIRADLFDLCQGRHPGRRSQAEITLYKNIGGGHLDLFTAQQVLARLPAGTAQ